MWHFPSPCRKSRGKENVRDLWSIQWLGNCPVHGDFPVDVLQLVSSLWQNTPVPPVTGVIHHQDGHAQVFVKCHEWGNLVLFPRNFWGGKNETFSSFCSWGSQYMNWQLQRHGPRRKSRQREWKWCSERSRNQSRIYPGSSKPWPHPAKDAPTLPGGIGRHISSSTCFDPVCIAVLDNSNTWLMLPWGTLIRASGPFPHWHGKHSSSVRKVIGTQLREANCWWQKSCRLAR